MSTWIVLTLEDAFSIGVSQDSWSFIIIGDFDIFAQNKNWGSTESALVRELFWESMDKINDLSTEKQF